MISASNISRHQFCNAEFDDDDRIFLDDRKPFRFRVLPDNISHLVKEGHTLFNLAGNYYKRIERAAGLWWVIADFQPNPIIDPTIKLPVGSILYVPSMRTVLTVIFSELRRNETDL